MNIEQLRQILESDGLLGQATRQAPYSSDAMALDLQTRLQAYSAPANPSFTRGDLVCAKPSISGLAQPVAIFVRWLDEQDPNDAAHIQAAIRERNTNGVNCIVAFMQKSQIDGTYHMSFAAEDSFQLQRYEWQTTASKVTG